MAVQFRLCAQLFITSILFLIQSPIWSQERPLRVAVPSNYIAPLGIYEHGELTGGYAFDMAHAVANELHMTVRYLYLPRRRIELALLAGEADLICYMNEGWSANKSDAYFWSPTFFKNQTLVVGVAGAPEIVSMDGLVGKHIGTVLGYFYPGLDELFADGKIKRDDAPDALSNYKKMVYGRNAYIVVNKLEHAYFLKHNPLNLAFNNGVVVVNEIELKCALSKKSALTPDALNAAVNRIVKSGLPELWIAKYR